MARLKTRWPGITSNRRTRAAVALEDKMGEAEQKAGEKEYMGLRRLQEESWAGRVPS